ncbi:MAG: arabinogalactan endo-1,4-beta-galactosidase [Flavobacterium sp. BFFFF1]|uniref:glycoside hydrolase family 53 protein n=1 Tax=Flavobacterium sp. BFFFF1 TaxID=2015557 RepID=UPI000BDABD4E|nr:glycosyl hydrolase 53 family protein [Flavobacterium sp. BFFFF1]OYU82298.1 MAG: arabinogalactan endo-1,4-beta-galactosidase [Flavobacterium sp. BFFFF1]
MKNLLFYFLLLLGLQSFSQDRRVYIGADLSYVNEIEDGAAHFSKAGKKTDPYALFAKKGCNIVRLRLWHSPEFAPYSNLADVKKSIRRAKAQGMQVLLDFHYSDTWADPGRQEIPKAWAKITDLNVLGDSIYNYTFNTLIHLSKAHLLPEMVQVGNETNSEILQPPGKAKDSINWKRNSFLFNKGLKAVRDASKTLNIKIESLLHIAQPENALKWFEQAAKNGITDFDVIGISYYPIWSKFKFEELPTAINTLVNTYKKNLIVVETAYPYTMQNIDKANNILTEKALIEGYPATPSGQLNYLVDLTKLVINAGGNGVIYWEPAWVTSSCKTMWGEGSHWDNATFFDAANNNEALPAFDFFNPRNYIKH